LLGGGVELIDLILCPLGHHLPASEFVRDAPFLLCQIAYGALNPFDVVDVEVDTFLEYGQFLLHSNL